MAPVQPDLLFQDYKKAWFQGINTASFLAQPFQIQFGW